MTPDLRARLARLARAARARGAGAFPRLHRRVRDAGPFTLVAGGLGAVLAFMAAGVITYTVIELHRFGRAEARRATFIYAAGQPLAPGISVRAVDLAGTLRSEERRVGKEVYVLV